MKAYKLFKIRKDGSLGPLFINPTQRIPVGVWLESEDHPTKGFAHRPGWHCCFKPHAPHLSTCLSSGQRRVWCEVSIQGARKYERPESQGGAWVLAERMKVVGILCPQPGK